MIRKFIRFIVSFFKKKPRAKGRAPIVVDYYITTHARERMEQRFRCSPHKQEKIAWKAWNSRDPLPHWYRTPWHQRKDKGTSYKAFLGCVFIFGLSYRQGKLSRCGLITVIAR